MTPAYLNTEWTDELFELMFEKRAVRLRRMTKQITSQSLPLTTSNHDFFTRHGIEVHHA